MERHRPTAMQRYLLALAALSGQPFIPRAHVPRQERDDTRPPPWASPRTEEPTETKQRTQTKSRSLAERKERRRKRRQKGRR